MDNADLICKDSDGGRRFVLYTPSKPIGGDAPQAQAALSPLDALIEEARTEGWERRAFDSEDTFTTIRPGNAVVLVGKGLRRHVLSPEEWARFHREVHERRPDEGSQAPVPAGAQEHDDCMFLSSSIVVIEPGTEIQWFLMNDLATFNAAVSVFKEPQAPQNERQMAAQQIAEGNLKMGAYLIDGHKVIGMVTGIRGEYTLLSEMPSGGISELRTFVQARMQQKAVWENDLKAYMKANGFTIMSTGS